MRTIVACALLWSCASQLPTRNSIDDMVSATVAFTNNALRESNPYCGGVWIDDETIVTAKHCIAASNQLIYESYIARSPVQLVGLTVHFIVNERDEPHAGTTVRLCAGGDIALVKSSSLRFRGKIPAIGRRPNVGDGITVVSHPAGYAWTVSRGSVSAFRRTFDSLHDQRVDVMQVDAALSFGSSGAGAFDGEGKLVGTMSFIHQSLPHASFFADVDSISALVRDDQVCNSSDLRQLSR